MSEGGLTQRNARLAGTTNIPKLESFREEGEKLFYYMLKSKERWLEQMQSVDLFSSHGLLPNDGQVKSIGEQLQEARSDIEKIIERFTNREQLREKPGNSELQPLRLEVTKLSASFRLIADTFDSTLNVLNKTRKLYTDKLEELHETVEVKRLELNGAKERLSELFDDGQKDKASLEKEVAEIKRKIGDEIEIQPLSSDESYDYDQQMFSIRTPAIDTNRSTTCYFQADSITPRNTLSGHPFQQNGVAHRWKEHSAQLQARISQLEKTIDIIQKQHPDLTSKLSLVSPRATQEGCFVDQDPLKLKDQAEANTMFAPLPPLEQRSRAASFSGGDRTYSVQSILSELAPANDCQSGDGTASEVSAPAANNYGLEKVAEDDENPYDSSKNSASLPLDGPVGDQFSEQKCSENNPFDDLKSSSPSSLGKKPSNKRLEMYQALEKQLQEATLSKMRLVENTSFEMHRLREQIRVKELELDKEYASFIKNQKDLPSVRFPWDQTYPSTYRISSRRNRFFSAQNRDLETAQIEKLEQVEKYAFEIERLRDIIRELSSNKSVGRASAQLQHIQKSVCGVSEGLQMLSQMFGWQ